MTRFTSLVRLLLLKLAVHKKPPLSRTQDSIATPLGHVPYKRSFVVKSQPWRPMVSARNAQWPDPSPGASEEVDE